MSPIDSSFVQDLLISAIGDTVAMGVPYWSVMGSSELFQTGQYFLPCTLTSVQTTRNPTAFLLSSGSSMKTLLGLQ